MFEKRKHPLATRTIFYKRLAKSLFFATILMFVSLVIGVLGYHFICKLTWIDALVNASMILGGMGEIDNINTVSGKIFISIYALYSGITFLSASAILMAPIFHRIMHTFHLDVDE